MSQCWRLCRSFWRAGAPGEIMEYGAVDSLLKVLSAGENLLFGKTQVQRPQSVTLVLRGQPEAACFQVSNQLHALMDYLLLKLCTLNLS